MKRHVDDLLPAYLTGTLDSSERARVEEHLKGCDSCRDAQDEWMSIASATRSLFASNPPSPGRGLDRIWDVIDASAESRPRVRRAQSATGMTRKEMKAMSTHALSPTPYPLSRRVTPIPWLAAGLVLMLVLGSFAWYSFSPGGGEPEPMPAVQFAGLATPTQSDCPDSAPDGMRNVTGTPVTASALTLPDGPLEGGFFVRPDALPTSAKPADKNTVNDLSLTLTALTACMNEDNSAGTWALTTEDYLRRFVETGRDPSDVEARAIIPMVGPVEGKTPVPEIKNAVVLKDGRVGAEIRPTIDHLPSTAAFFDYYVFVLQDGRWLIDEAAHVQGIVQIDVTVDDHGFSPDTLTVAAQPAELVLNNEGTVPHSLVSLELGLRVEAAPGESATVSLKSPAGTYTFTSDIPGDDAQIFTGAIVFEGETEFAHPTMASDSNESSVDVGGNVVPTVAPAEAGASVTSGGDSQIVYPTVAPVDADPSITSGVPLASVTIRANAPYAFSPERVFILANRDVEITLVNEGILEANFTIDALDISVNLAGGETKTVTVNAPEGGYAFYSTIPGHTEVGMTGTLIVKDQQSGP